jgi:hypothetical protein
MSCRRGVGVSDAREIAEQLFEHYESARRPRFCISSFPRKREPRGFRPTYRELLRYA